MSTYSDQISVCTVRAVITPTHIFLKGIFVTVNLTPKETSVLYCQSQTFRTYCLNVCFIQCRGLFWDLIIFVSPTLCCNFGKKYDINSQATILWYFVWELFKSRHGHLWLCYCWPSKYMSNIVYSGLCLMLTMTF